jgi:hypothetical protein
MAQALRVYSTHKVIVSDTALDTARFCELVDELFDLSNGISKNSLYKFDSFKMKIDSWYKWLDNLHFLQSNGSRCNRLKFHIGWQFSLRSLTHVFMKLQAAGLSNELICRNLTQDHVENGFSCIRRRGGFNDCPEYREAAAAFRSIAVNQFLGSSHTQQNCKDDHGNNLLQTAIVPTPAGDICSESTAEEFEPSETALPVGTNPSEAISHSQGEIGEEKSAYIAGWLLLRLFKLHSHCEKCRQQLCVFRPR